MKIPKKIDFENRKKEREERDTKKNLCNNDKNNSRIYIYVFY